MTAEAIAQAPGAAPPLVLPIGERLRLLSWAFLLVVIVTFAAPNGGLIGIPVVFFLKNRLHLSANGIALFNLWIGVPLYASFVFGLVRDRWSPFGAGDRGHLVVFGLAAAALYVAIAFLPPTYAILLAGLRLVTALLQSATSAANALFSGLGRHHAMTGQAGAALAAGTMIPLILGYLLGGVFSGLLEGGAAIAAARALFLAGAGLTLAVALFGAFGPAELFRLQERSMGASFVSDVARLAKSRAAWPPVAILFLWNFAPAWGVALQYHMASALHAKDAQVGGFYAIYWGTFLPLFFFYGWLCQRVRLSRIFWGTLLGVPSMLPLLFIHSATGALIMAVPIGLMSGVATIAYFDLAIRSCPSDLQGMMMMLAIQTTNFVAGRFGDVWGTWLYEHKGGFTAAVIASTISYALILPILSFAPRALTHTSDGEPLEGGDRRA